jgi:hypothetical protein
VIANLEFRCQDGLSSILAISTTREGSETCRFRAYSVSGAGCPVWRDGSNYHNAPFPISKRTRRGPVVGTILTPNHAHAALKGVFGMLAIALMVFVLRQTADEVPWASIEKYIMVGFWGTNIGLLMMVALSLFPGGVLQVWDVVQHGYWHARNLAYTGSDTAHTIEWLRLPGDLVFIIFGAVPLTMAAIKAYVGIRLDR